MVSLLNKAIRIRERLKFQSDLDDIPYAEREEIFEEIDREVNSEKREITEDLLAFKSVKNDKKLVYLVNLGALAVIIFVGLFFVYFFNRAEIEIISPGRNVNETENRVIQALKSESEEKLKEKNNEISSIRQSLEKLQQDRQNQIEEFRENTNKIELEMREKLRSELQAEKAKLEREGLSTEDVEVKLSEMSALKEREFDEKMDEILREEEEQRIKWENSYRDQLSQIESSLLEAQREKTELEETRNELAEERSEAEARISRLDEIRREEELVFRQLTGLYSEIRTFMESDQTKEAEETLSKLEKLVNDDSYKTLPSSLYRRELDLFMIESLVKMNDNNEQSEQLLSNVSELVSTGNNYYESGEYQMARSSYLEAISQIPILETGYNRLESISEMEKENEQEIYENLIQTGDRFFKDGEIERAMAAYEEADIYIDSDYSRVPQILKNMVSYYSDQLPGNNEVLVSKDDLLLMKNAKKSLESYRLLLEKIEHLKTELISRPDSSSSGVKEETVSLLNSKIQIRELLSSDSIKELYPELEDKFDDFLNGFGKDKEKEGRNSALSDIAVLTSDIDENYVNARNDEERTLYILFLKNLEDLIKNPES